jgi:hypothetical protein
MKLKSKIRITYLVHAAALGVSHPSAGCYDGFRITIVTNPAGLENIITHKPLRCLMLPYRFMKTNNQTLISHSHISCSLNLLNTRNTNPKHKPLSTVCEGTEKINDECMKTNYSKLN